MIDWKCAARVEKHFNERLSKEEFVEREYQKHTYIDNF